MLNSEAPSPLNLSDKNNQTNSENTPISHSDPNNQMFNDLTKIPSFNDDKVKHKIQPSCLNKCTKWSLKISKSSTKDKSLKNIYQSDSYYFSKTDASILNTLQNNNFKLNNSHIEIIDKIKNDSNKKLIEKDSENLCKKLLDIKFPIDNSSFNFMIIDANLGIKDNLKNIFFLEFDLTHNENNINNINIREINDECVDKDLNMSLNGVLHDNIPLFKSDINFSLEYREFIKSIQFRIKNYQNQLAYGKQFKGKGNGYFYKGLKKNNDTQTFYAKVLSNINIGIEFSKINTENEFYHTNFNSIVNLMKIKINKIYLEVSIPKIFFEKENINIERIKSIDKIGTNKNSIAYDNYKKTNDIDNNQDNHYSEISIDTTATDESITQNNYNNRHYSNSNVNPNFNNIYDRMQYNYHKSPNMFIKNNINLQGQSNKNYIMNQNQNDIHTKIMNNLMNSPIQFVNQIQMMSKDNKNIDNKNQLLFSPLSPLMQGSPYFPISQYSNFSFNNQIGSMNNMNININNNNFPHMKFSMTYLNKLSGNPLSSMQEVPNIFKTPILMRTNNPDEELISSMPTMIFSPKINPKEFCDNNEYMNNMNCMNRMNNMRSINNMNNMMSMNNNYNMNTNNMQSPLGGISTIHKRIIDWEKNNSNSTNKEISNKNCSYINKYTNEEKEKINTEKNLQNLFTDKRNKYSLIDNYVTKNKQLIEANKKSFTEYFKEYNNLDIFLNNITPKIMHNPNNQNNNTNFPLLNLFKSFFKLSTFGVKIKYNYSKDLNSIHYSCTLSSMEFKLTNKTIINKLLINLYEKKISKIKNLSELAQNSISNEIYFPIIYIQGLSIKISNEELTFMYYENKPCHFRQTFMSVILSIFNFFPEIKDVKLCDINLDDSWFAILFFPSVRGEKSKTSFIVYYPIINFDKVDGKDRLSIIGILPIKFENGFYFWKVSKPNNTACSIDSKSFLYLRSLVNNVIKVAIDNKEKTSFDYDCFIKSNNEVNIIKI